MSTFDEVIGGRPAADGRGGERLVGSQRIRELLNELSDAVRLGSRGRDPIGRSRQEREPIGCRAANDDAVDCVLELAEERIGGGFDVGRIVGVIRVVCGLGAESNEARGGWT